MGNLTYQDVRKQSQAVFNQFGEKKWIPFANINAKLKNRRSPLELQNIGLGKVLVSVAMGESTEEKLPILKQYRDKVDILVCDKGFGPLLEQGIKADYVMLCDCNILYDKWIKKYIDQTDGVKLIATPYANTDWTQKWKGPIYFYVNKDAIASENIFLKIMGPQTRVIPASSNVSNAQIVFMTGLDEWDQTNFAAYDKIFLIGYDYSWRFDGKYYSWNDPRPKRFYMHHRTMIDCKGNMVFTSENLVFSAKWLAQYVNGWKLPVYNASDRGLLFINQVSLEKELQKINIANRDIYLANFQTLAYAQNTYKTAEAAFNQSRRLLWQ